jgi:uncharacterized protein YdbL (DUF1318 family)
VKEITVIRILAAWLLACVATFAGAQANLEINTPAINNLKKAMAERHAQLSPHYLSGAVGIARDGSIALANANAVPLPQRAGVGGLIAAENTDRSALYREIARANGKPEWEAEIRNTFGERWIEKAQPGWSVQNAAGQWVRK